MLFLMQLSTSRNIDTVNVSVLAIPLRTKFWVGILESLCQSVCSFVCLSCKCNSNLMAWLVCGEPLPVALMTLGCEWRMIILLQLVLTVFRFSPREKNVDFAIFYPLVRLAGRNHGESFMVWLPRQALNSSDKLFFLSVEHLICSTCSGQWCSIVFVHTHDSVCGSKEFL